MTPDVNPGSALAEERRIEQTRLDELSRYAITFDEPEPAFDSAVDLVRHLTGAPLAGISIVDNETVWLKSRQGVDMCSVARSVSFCTIAIQADGDLFLVPDTRDDPRFKDHPLVLDAPHVRSYAAAPLHSQNGHAIGTLWLMDTRPNALDPMRQAVLRMMATHVVTLLDMRYLSGELRLRNRAGFVRQMRDRMANTDRGALVVGSVNLRGLRHINDAYGHEAGDLAIGEVARQLRAWGDAGQPDAPLTGHLEGGNFAFLLQGEESRANAASLTDALRHASIPVGDQRLPVVATVSLVDCADMPPNTPALLDRAVLIAREAPNSGVSALIDQRDLAASSGGELAMDLQAVLAGNPSGGRLEVHYQPTFDIAQARLVGFEALSRWWHPSQGMISPGHFLPLAERMGALYQLDLHAFTQVCRTIAAWTAEGHPPPRISTNLARATLLVPDLCDTLTGIAANHGVSPQSIELEITEAGVVEQRALIGRVRDLRAAGFSIAIDDFGTGMSNVASLHELPCDTLKIDRRFVTGLANDPKAAALCRLLLGVAAALDVRVVCEGVEAESDAFWLHANGATLIQGWYFAKALTPEQAARMNQRHALGDFLAQTDAAPQTTRALAALRQRVNGVLSASATTPAATTPPPL